jgi:diaminopimelate decarboxylase
MWNGPIKNPNMVRDFLLKGGIVNIDSLEEMEMLKTVIAEHPGHVFPLGIRCNFDVNDGVISRFGFDIDGSDFHKAISFFSHTPNIKFVNLQCHFAKRQIDYWPTRAKKMVELFDRLEITPERIDLGGGLFGKMTDFMKAQFHNPIPSYLEYAKVAATELAEKFGNSGPEMVIEPGSALVGDCLKFIGTVKTIKCIRGKFFASILGSRNNINMNGINPPIEIIPSGNAQTEYEKIDLVGYTCIENDVLYKDFSGKMAVGDSIVISNCGSYSLVMKPPFILPNFPVLAFSGDKIEVVKRAETFDDIFRSYVF